MKIYDEAIEEVKYYDTYSYDSDKVLKALERAKKVEELLGLYQQSIRLMVCVPQNETYHYVVRYTDDMKFNSLLNKIKALEEELK
jgi:hypothetical protein